SQDKSKAVEALTLLPKQLQQQLPLTYYWGGMTKPGEVGTSGPPYVGAIICFLAIFGMFVLENKHKWWILTAVGLTIMMSWGGYFEGFNTILYKYLPLYNKFRAPSMILVIPQLLLPLLAVLCVDRITKEKDKKALLPWFKKGMIATAVIFLMLFLLYLTFEFLSTSDKEILKQVREMNNPQLLQAVDSFFDGLKADRKSLMLGDIFRSLGFIAVAGLLLFLLLRNIIKPLIVIISLAILLLIDVMAIDVKYLNSDSYVDMVENEGVFLQTKTDKEILADKSFFRVYNVSGNAFSENITSYYYNSVGGYHAAKLIIYQDLIERQLSKDNQKVLDMLNTKYLIQKDQNGQTKASQTRGSALGPVWFVQTISYVKNADEEMAALNYFNPKNTAIVQESFMASIPFTPQPDSASTIRLLKNDNDIINYTSEAAANQFAVFSEIYYDAGWRAFIDGKESPIVKVNYVLRGLSVPAGKHTIEFRFEPSGYLKGKKLTSIFSILLLLLLVISIFMEWRKYKSLQLPNRA
ncbi:MAG: YfhO family protein, partial [Bacteroidota bacterium]|nr:YfhO family protein [Bacteroidota bacterium]